MWGFELRELPYSKQAHYANFVTHLHNFASHFYSYTQGGRARQDFSLAWLNASWKQKEI